MWYTTGALLNVLSRYSRFSSLKQSMKFETYTLKTLEKPFSKPFKRQSLILCFLLAYAQSAYFFFILFFIPFLGKKTSWWESFKWQGSFDIGKLNAIQNFFAKAIRKNKGNTQNTTKVIWAILDHYSSTANQQKYDRFPKGENSWCPYQLVKKFENAQSDC